MQSRMRTPRWAGRVAAAGLAVAALATCASLDPMRWSLPVRYLFAPFDIHRDGFIDFTMCMRVALSPSEAEAFVSNEFEPKDQIVQPVPMEQAICPAEFWPEAFTTPTMACWIDYFPAPRGGHIAGSRGAVYQDGYLYFWSNDL